MLASLDADWLVRQFQDPWVLFGFAAQLLFFARFAVQWFVSEQKGKVHIPIAFWYLSLSGGILTLIYATKRQDIVFMVSQALGIAIYLRNLWLIYARRMRIAARRAPSLDTPSSQA